MISTVWEKSRPKFEHWVPESRHVIQFRNRHVYSTIPLAHFDTSDFCLDVH